MLTSDKQIILNIGRLVSKKAVSDLIEAYAIAEPMKAMPEETLLVIAGAGPDRPRLEKIAGQRRVADATFVGRVDDHDAGTSFRQCRQFAYFPGAVGLALNQAMAAGRPVVCADEKGPDSELLVHEVNGLRYEKGDVLALARAIRRLLETPHLQEKLGWRARETVRERATMENMISQFASALRRAMDPAAQA